MREITPWSPTLHPDGFTGAILAIEGIRDAAVILHGPTGCRGHHCAFSERAFPRESTPELLNYAERFFFGQHRIPTTFLDGNDFVFGASEKLREAIDAVLKKAPALLAVVNSPGAALIGEDLQRILADASPSVPRVAIDMPAISQPMAEGWQRAIIAALEAIDLQPQPARPRTVNLLGVSIAHQHWEGSLRELRRLVSLCGVDVLCAPGAGSPLAQWRLIPQAECHAVVHSEYGRRIAGWLEKRFEGTVVVPESGAPLGFAATEEWISMVVRAANADPSPALDAIAEMMRRVARILSRITGLTGSPKGLTAAIHADPSLALPLAQFLYEYLGILPVPVETPPPAAASQTARLQDYLCDIGCADVWQVPWQTVDSDFFFADGHQVSQKLALGHSGVGIDLMLPVGGYLDIVPKALLGAEGAAYLTEYIINSVVL